MTTTFRPYNTEAGLFADRGVASYRVAETTGPAGFSVLVQALDKGGKVIAASSHSAMLFAALSRLPRR